MLRKRHVLQDLCPSAVPSTPLFHTVVQALLKVPSVSIAARERQRSLEQTPTFLDTPAFQIVCGNFFTLADGPFLIISWPKLPASPCFVACRPSRVLLFKVAVVDHSFSLEEALQSCRIREIGDTQMQHGELRHHSIAGRHVFRCAAKRVQATGEINVEFVGSAESLVNFAKRPDAIEQFAVPIVFRRDQRAVAAEKDAVLVAGESADGSTSGFLPKPKHLGEHANPLRADALARASADQLRRRSEHARVQTRADLSVRSRDLLTAPTIDH